MSDDVLDQARRRYAAEREKRLRRDGIGQYNVLEGEYEDFDRDPWAADTGERQPVVEEVDVVVLGGGFSGMLAAIDLKKRGIDSLRIIEKGGDFGGTWYWNRYPGCRCDVQSYIYMPFLEETGYMPTEKYARAPEIFEHCQRVGRHFDLYAHALFQTEIDTAVWNDDTDRWAIVTTRGDRLETRFLVSAGGLLHKAKLPAIAGIDRFEGRMFHTARWDYSYTGGGPTNPMTKLEGKRVGIIGTGATAVQAVPELAAAGAEVYVFQRTPAAVGVRGNGPTDEAWFRSLEPGWQRERIRNFTAAVSGEQPSSTLIEDGWTEVMWEDTTRAAPTDADAERLDRIDLDVMEGIRTRVDEVVTDPDTAARLKPWWGKHCKRICFHDGYLQAFNLPNVHLVDTDGAGVREIGPDGPIVDGTAYPVDLLIFASGFEITSDYVRRLGFDPVGRDGQPLSERWHDGAHTLHGVTTANFPNMCMIAIAQSAQATNFVHFISVMTDHIAAMIDTCLDRGIRQIEPEPAAEDAWLHFLWGRASTDFRPYAEFCTPSYYNSEGVTTSLAARGAVFMGNVEHFADHLAAWRSNASFEGMRILRRSALRGEQT